MDKKTCRQCRKEKIRDEFYDHPQMRDGKLNRCKECVKGRVRLHREENDSVREYDRRRYRESPERRMASEAHQKRNPERTKLVKQCSQMVRRAVLKGIVAKATHCESCGLLETEDRKLEGAHSDYTKPLEVRWLCRRCHRREDAAQPKFRASA